MRRESRLEGAWTHALCNVWLNGKQRLVDCESNKSMLESLLQPTEEPSAAIYSTIALSYPTNFSWETPQAKPTKEDQRNAFDLFVRENNLSSVEANFNLFKESASVEHYAGASGIERAHYANQAAQARQKFLINTATPSELRAEAKFQSATEREEFQRAEAERSHKIVLAQQQQSGIYPPLPATDENGNVIDSKFIKKLSTVDFPRFKAMVKRFGSGAVTQRLRGE
jgi:hypothetical protein